MALRKFCLVLILLSSKNSLFVSGSSEEIDEQADSANIQPKFISQSGEHTFLAGSHATLPCRVADLSEVEAVQWIRVRPNDGNEQSDPEQQSEVLFTARVSMTADPRMEIPETNDENNYDLHINDVVAFDSGEYQCHITTTPAIIQPQILNVKVPPTVNIVPDTNPYTPEPGQLISLNCDGGGNPRPKVTWTRVGDSLPDGRGAMVQGDGHARLDFTSANTNHSGLYRCTADNDVGEPAMGSIVVDVVSKDAPKIAPKTYTALKFVPVNEHQNVSISCNYTANPLPLIHWYYNGLQMNSHSQKYRDRVSITDEKPKPGHPYWTTTLTIANIQETDFGEYICKVDNNLGDSSQEIHVSGRPGPPYLFNASVTDDRIDFSWLVESAPDMLRHKLFYRKPGADFSLEIGVPVEASRRTNGNEWEGRYTWRFDDPSLPKLTADTEYEMAVQGVNQYGDGSLPKSMLIARTPAKLNGVEVKKVDSEKMKDYEAQKAKSVNPGATGSSAIHRPGLLSLIATGAVLVLASMCWRSSS